MPLKDFKAIYFILSLFTFFVYFILMLLSIGYEEDTNKTNIAKISYFIINKLNFSYKYWGQLFPYTVSFCLSILTSSFLYSLIIFFLLKFKKQ